LYIFVSFKRKRAIFADIPCWCMVMTIRGTGVFHKTNVIYTTFCSLSNDFLTKSEIFLPHNTTTGIVMSPVKCWWHSFRKRLQFRACISDHKKKALNYNDERTNAMLTAPPVQHCQRRRQDLWFTSSVVSSLYEKSHLNGRCWCNVMTTPRDFVIPFVFFHC
jgi:hypothetical protein